MFALADENVDTQGQTAGSVSLNVRLPKVQSAQGANQLSVVTTRLRRKG